MTCPVVKAVEEIKTGGFYTEDDQEPKNIAISGGVEYVCDSVSFAFNILKIELARFRVNGAKDPNNISLAKCKEFYNNTYAEFFQSSYGDIYDRVMEESTTLRLLQVQIESANRMLGVVFNAMLRKSQQYAREGKPINFVIPGRGWVVSYGQIHKKFPWEIYEEVEDVVSHLSAFKIIDSKTGSPDQPIEFPEFDDSELPNGSIPGAKTFTSADEYLEESEKILKLLEPVYAFAIKVETYFCRLITVIEEVINQCKKMLNMN